MILEENNPVLRGEKGILRLSTQLKWRKEGKGPFEKLVPWLSSLVDDGDIGAPVLSSHTDPDHQIRYQISPNLPAIGAKMHVRLIGFKTPPR